jgi:hypothetical protein
LDRYGVRLLPSSSDRSHLIAASVAWGPFAEGDYLTIAITRDSYLATGTATVISSATKIQIPAGVHDFAVPAGVTHVALYSAEASALGAVWKS